MNESDQRPRLLGIDAVIRETGLGRTTLYGLMADGRLRSVKVGRRRLVPAEAIDSLVASLLAGTDEGDAA